MSDYRPDYPSTETIANLRKSAVLYLVCGVVLFVSRITAGMLVVPIVIGAIFCAIGAGWVMANNPVNKKTGIMLIGIGALVVLSIIRISILPVIAGIALSIIAVYCLVMGIKNLVQYIRSNHG